MVEEEDGDARGGASPQSTLGAVQRNFEEALTSTRMICYAQHEENPTNVKNLW